MIDATAYVVGYVGMTLGALIVGCWLLDKAWDRLCRTLRLNEAIIGYFIDRKAYHAWLRGRKGGVS